MEQLQVVVEKWQLEGGFLLVMIRPGGAMILLNRVSILHHKFPTPGEVYIVFLPYKISRPSCFNGTSWIPQIQLERQASLTGNWSNIVQRAIHYGLSSICVVRMKQNNWSTSTDRRTIASVDTTAPPSLVTETLSTSSRSSWYLRCNMSQLIHSRSIYHGLPVYPESQQGLTAIVTGANGISGNHMVLRTVLDC